MQRQVLPHLSCNHPPPRAQRWGVKMATAIKERQNAASTCAGTNTVVGSMKWAQNVAKDVERNVAASQVLCCHFRAAGALLPYVTPYACSAMVLSPMMEGCVKKKIISLPLVLPVIIIIWGVSNFLAYHYFHYALVRSHPHHRNVTPSERI